MLDRITLFRFFVAGSHNAISLCEGADMITKALSISLVFAFVVIHVIAESIPGTSVSIKPPDGFVETDRFSGFIERETASSIMVVEMPAPYAEATAGLTEQNLMEAKQMSLLSKTTITVDGHAAILLHMEQPGYGTLFRKWILVVDRSDYTVLITASYPKAAQEPNEERLKAAILSASFVESTDPTEALAFIVEPRTPFEIAHVMGQNLILSEHGRFPVEEEGEPFMIVGLSATEGLAVEDKREFVEGLLAQFAERDARDVVLQPSNPVTVADLSGYATTATAVGEEAGTSLSYYQVILFDEAGYSIIWGRASLAEADHYKPIFEEIAQSFRMKESRDATEDHEENQ